MSSLLTSLREFNRKERFFLIGRALGNSTFRLSSAFRKDLSDALGLRIPEDGFAAMDYHLDWLAVALYLTAHSGGSGPYTRDPQIFTATQEDLDFLMAYEDDRGCHVIMLEAKGVRGFSNRQFCSKVKRLTAMFGSPEAKAVRAIPRFALLSPRRPQRLECKEYPSWMLRSDGGVAWLKLSLPRGLKKVVRCHRDGTVNQSGDYWKVVSDRHAG